MTNEIHDYLTKQLFIDKNIVTFRSLSRQFKIHVNAAKNELATFHANPDPSSGSVHATYLLTGELASTRVGHGDKMDVDDDMHEDEDDDSEPVQEMRVALVGEQDLESVKSTYARVFSQHVYCLSPSPVIDAGLVCTPSEKVYEADTKLKQDEAALLGRVIGPHVQKGKPVKFSSVPAKEPLTRKPTEPTLKSVKKDEKDDKKDEKPAEQKKLKSAGTLDWSKAKPKAKVEEKKDEKPREEPKPKDEPKLKAKPSLKPAASKSALPAKPKPEPRPEPKQVPKRGTKRKSALAMDSSEEEEAGASSRPSSKPSSKVSSPASSPAASPAASPPPPTQVPKLKRMVVISDDDEDDDAPPRPARGKARPRPTHDVDVDALPSRREKSLRAMMDIDDDHVERVSRRPAPPPPSSDGASSPASLADLDVESEGEFKAELDGDGDVAMDDYAASLDVKRKRKPRAPKKAVPVGRNGRPKRRVVHSVTSVNEDGYMETVDKSDYESVASGDEDPEPAPEPKAKKPRAKKSPPGKPAKGKGKGAAGDTEDEDVEEKPARGLKAEKTKVVKEEKEEKKKGFRPGPPVKRASGSKVGQGSLKDFFGKK
ncbi:DNA polymerase subunit Cdc27 [Phanerochaete sordida]|uniref:DNA polymerase delta subunit 3 n=1 Tax=Phanerochaete sordida TaxID=48140 RepID=A0A9P3L7D6_9APHY|nr:DNA polymerase subunit Cdc27 [Phanerochaete sordida]